MCPRIGKTVLYTSGMPRAPLVNLRVPPGEREAWVRAAGGESLSGWIRRTCNIAAARSGLGLGEREAVVGVPDLARPKPASPVAEPERSERNAVVVEDRRSVGERWAERLRRAGVDVDGAVAGPEPGPTVESPALAVREPEGDGPAPEVDRVTALMQAVCTHPRSAWVFDGRRQVCGVCKKPV